MSYGPEMESPNRPKRHRVRWAFGILAVIIAAIIILALAVGGKPGPKTGGSAATNPTPETTFAPPTSAAPVTSPAVQPANRVEFVITGNVPASQFGGLDIDYGSDSNTHDVSLPSLAGKVKYVMPFDGSAEFYSVDVTFSSAGTVNCRIVVLGPKPDVPLTVSRGSATGGNNGSDCSAQAAPENSQGTSWDNEQ